jgi:hypothetical protein
MCGACPVFDTRNVQCNSFSICNCLQYTVTVVDMTEANIT